MNKLCRWVVLFFCGLLIVNSMSGQGTHTPLEDVINSIRNNRLQEISRYYDNFVPITINNNPSNYSHNQAELVLQDFFEKNPARDFVITDSGSPGGNSMFAIANFKTPNGKYSLYVLLRLKDKSYFVKEIRITKE